MSLFVIVLIFISCLMHVGWNLVARHQRQEMAFFGRMLLVIAGVGFLPAAASELSTHSIPGRAWIYVLLSGTCCGMYFYFLAKAYSSGDFTVVYPVARGLPILLIGLTDVARGRYPSVVGWLGMLILVCGCVIAPLQSLRQFNFRRYITRHNSWLVLTALGTVGYSFFDKLGSELVQQGPFSAARYGYVFFLTATIVYHALLRLSGNHKLHNNNLQLGRLKPLVAALFNYSSYWLVLWAYQMTARASYVVAFRQISILIGVVLGLLIYHESDGKMRIYAAFMIVIGLILISVWG